MFVRRGVASWGAWLVLVGSALSAPAPDFAREVLPILSDHCFQCHGPDPATREAGLRLDVQAEALRTEQPVIQPGSSGTSELIRRLVTSDADERMPPPKAKKPLSPGQIDTLRRWVDAGAPWGRHWAYEPIRRPDLPALRDSAGVRNPIDLFIRARLEQEGLKPAAEATRETLIRRVTLDLTGVPPTPEEVEAFLHDTRPGAYERVVDRLLASPRYGERMSWDWLDAARYADSNGFQGDPERTMWPWRDWVVRALNANQPYDQFTIEQLAGDLLPNATLEQRVATGFNRNHMINGEGGRIAEETRVENVFDRVETTATVWLGVTMTCCRCHTHKFDPFTIDDYFGLYAIFNNTSEDGAGRSGQAAPNLELASPADLARRAVLSAQVREATASLSTVELATFPRAADQPASASAAAEALPMELRDLLKQPVEKRDAAGLGKLAAHFKEPGGEYFAALERLRKLLDERTNFERSIPRVMVMDDRPERRETFRLTRGAYNQLEEKIEPALPRSLPPLPSGEAPNRLGLARWLVSPEQPLTARVTVNRFWQTFFGWGLVKTSEDFGVQGERPSHPELLDWLASEFRDQGWDVKRLIRLIVTSATYRQRSQLEPGMAERDPENRLLARGPRYRLPSWMIRDQALAAAGLLVELNGGPSVKPYQPPGIWEEATFGNKRYVEDRGESLYRRSLYVFWRRIVGPTMFFDTSARQVCSIKPSRTNTPLQALATLNDTTYVEAARHLALRARREATSGADDERLARAFQLVTGRLPRAAERKVVAEALERCRGEYRADADSAARLLSVGDSALPAGVDHAELAAWTSVSLMLLNLDETLTKE